MDDARFEEGAEAESPAAARADTPRAAIAREIVGLHKRPFGRGPTSCKAYVHDDCVVVLMAEGHTTGEGTLERAGGARSVAQSRVDVSESVRQDFIDVVERRLGRDVIGFMSSSQQEPSLLSHVYVLAPTDLLHPEG